MDGIEVLGVPVIDFDPYWLKHGAERRALLYLAPSGRTLSSLTCQTLPQQRPHTPRSASASCVRAFARSCPCSLRINQTGHLLIAHLPPHAPFDGGSASREAETTTGVCNLACNERQPPSATHKMNIYLYFCLCYGCLSRCGQSVVQRSTTSTCPGQPACISRWDKPPKKLAWTSPPSQSD